MANLYRKSSIEKLSNPEQLDRAIVVSSPMSWLALIGIALIIVATVIWSIVGTLPTTTTVNGIFVGVSDTGAYYSDSAGTVTKVLKKNGDRVNAGDIIAKMKNSVGNEIEIKAAEQGVLTDLLITENSKIYAGAEVARYTPSIEGEQVVVCYVPLVLATQIEEEMQVLLYPSGIDSQKYGHMEAVVIHVGDYPASTSNLWYVLGADNLVAEQFVANGPVVAVLCEIELDADTKSGFYWSSKNGESLTLSNGTYVSAKIVVDECAPITKLIRNIREKIEE